MPTPDSEARWVLLAQCHDRDALEQLLSSALPSLRRYLRHLIGPQHSDDVTQEVLIIVCRKIGWLRQADLFRPWLFRVASRAAFRYLKKEKRWSDQIRNSGVLDHIAAPEAPSTDVLRELHSRDDLSPASRAVLILHFEEGLTLPEVAAVLDVPVGTIKSRLAYGLATLRTSTEAKERKS